MDNEVNMNGLPTLSQLKAVAEREEKRERQEREERQLAWWIPEWGVIVLNAYGRSGDNWWKCASYEVDASELDSPNSLVQWISHLREKRWFTPQMMSDFIDVFEETIGGNFTGWAHG